MENAIQPTLYAGLNQAILGFERQLALAAEQNCNILGAELTQTERHAVVVVEQLKLINGLDLAAVMMRGKLLRQIEEEALWSLHPNQYDTLETMARDQGISISELSNIRDLYNIVFPYLSETLGLNIAEEWERIGKSKFRELVPYLKALATGEDPQSDAAREAVNRFLAEAEDIERNMAEVAGEIYERDDEQLRRVAAENLIEAGRTMTNRDLRATIRPERTNSLAPTVIDNGAGKLVVMEVDEDQWTMLQRRLNGYMDPVVMRLSNDPQIRQAEAVRVPAIRNIIRLLEG